MIELTIIPIEGLGSEPWRYLGVVSGPGLFRVRRSLCPLRLARWGNVVRMYALGGKFETSSSALSASLR